MGRRFRSVPVAFMKIHGGTEPVVITRLMSFDFGLVLLVECYDPCTTHCIVLSYSTTHPRMTDRDRHDKIVDAVKTNDGGRASYITYVIRTGVSFVSGEHGSSDGQLMLDNFYLC